MKIKSDYIMREVAGNHVVVPTGKAALDFSGVMTLNETGAFLWNLLVEDRTEAELLSALLAEYDVEKAIAELDISQFISRLKAADLFV